MSRATRLNRTIRRAVERQLEKTIPKTTPPRKRVWAVVLFVIGVPGILTALLALLPRMTPSVSDPVNSNDPFSSLVTITNTGLVPIFSATPYLRLIFITDINHKKVHGPTDGPGARVRCDNWPKNQTMWLDDKISFSLNEAIGGQGEHHLMAYLNAANLRSADLAVVMEYQIPIIHWKRSKEFPIHTFRQTNGNFYWSSGNITMPSN